jgi:hypothetical protein
MQQAAETHLPRGTHVRFDSAEGKKRISTKRVLSAAGAVLFLNKLSGKYSERKRAFYSFFRGLMER